MPKRAPILDVTAFTYLFYYVMYESEETDDTFDDNEIFALAFEALGSDDLALAFVARFRGLIRLLELLETEGYIANIEGEMKFHPGVFEAAATARTRANGNFPEKPFLQKVSQFADGKYRDFRLGA